MANKRNGFLRRSACSACSACSASSASSLPRLRVPSLGYLPYLTVQFAKVPYLSYGRARVGGTGSPVLLVLLLLPSKTGSHARIKSPWNILEERTPPPTLPGHGRRPISSISSHAASSCRAAQASFSSSSSSPLRDICRPPRATTSGSPRAIAGVQCHHETVQRTLPPKASLVRQAFQANSKAVKGPGWVGRRGRARVSGRASAGGQASQCRRRSATPGESELAGSSGRPTCTL